MRWSLFYCVYTKEKNACKMADESEFLKYIFLGIYPGRAKSLTESFVLSALNMPDIEIYPEIFQ